MVYLLKPPTNMDSKAKTVALLEGIVHCSYLTYNHILLYLYQEMLVCHPTRDALKFACTVQLKFMIVALAWDEHQGKSASTSPPPPPPI